MDAVKMPLGDRIRQILESEGTVMIGTLYFVLFHYFLISFQEVVEFICRLCLRVSTEREKDPQNCSHFAK